MILHKLRISVFPECLCSALMSMALCQKSESVYDVKPFLCVSKCVMCVCIRRNGTLVMSWMSRPSWTPGRYRRASRWSLWRSEVAKSGSVRSVTWRQTTHPKLKGKMSHEHKCTVSVIAELECTLKPRCHSLCYQQIVIQEGIFSCCTQCSSLNAKSINLLLNLYTICCNVWLLKKQNCSFLNSSFGNNNIIA